MPSSLGSTATQSIIHLRNQKTSDGWAGENVDTTVEISPSIPCRVEWVEGGGKGWDIWVFEEDNDFQIGDMFITDQVPDTVLVVLRVSSWDNLKGVFHHYEIKTEESEAAVDQVVP